MAFDGITIASIVREMKNQIEGGRIYKIAQPEKDELLLTIKNNGGQVRVIMSADASLPLLYLTQENKTSPMTAPNFCMLLRKHLQNARIVAVDQPMGLERIVKLQLEHLNELGDLCTKYLVIELMGKHSNIIFYDDQNMIIDSIKHISGMVSSVREVLPGREYFIPNTQDKEDPLTVSREEIHRVLTAVSRPVFKAIYGSFTGISPCIAHEVCYRAGVDADKPSGELTEVEMDAVCSIFLQIMKDVKEGNFVPNVVYENNQPAEYAAVRLTSYADDKVVLYDSMSELIEHYYAEKNIVTRIIVANRAQRNRVIPFLHLCFAFVNICIAFPFLSYFIGLPVQP